MSNASSPWHLPSPSSSAESLPGSFQDVSSSSARSSSSSSTETSPQIHSRHGLRECDLASSTSSSCLSSPVSNLAAKSPVPTVCDWPMAVVKVASIVHPSGEAVNLETAAFGVSVRSVGDLQERIRGMNADKLVKVALICPQGRILEDCRPVELGKKDDEGVILTALITPVKLEVSPGTLLQRMAKPKAADNDSDEDILPCGLDLPCDSFVIWPGMDPRNRSEESYVPDLDTIPEARGECQTWTQFHVPVLCPVCRGEGRCGIFGHRGFGVLTRPCKRCEGMGRVRQ